MSQSLQERVIMSPLYFRGGAFWLEDLLAELEGAHPEDIREALEMLTHVGMLTKKGDHYQRKPQTSNYQRG